MEQKVICNDCIVKMQSMEPDSIDLIITSPPYNLSIPYHLYKDNLEYKDYLNWMNNVFKEMKRVLKNEGSFFLNVGGSCKNPYVPFDLCNKAREVGFALQNNIIWVKSITINDNSYGHFKPINSDRFINHQHESIFHFTKNGDVKLNKLAIGTKYADKSNIGRYSDIDCRDRGNIWFLPYHTTQKKKEHPAGFPVELPEMCIKLAGIKDNMTVLDPFMGAGTTLVACKKLGVKGIGIELDQHYCDIAKTRLVVASVVDI